MAITVSHAPKEGFWVSKDVSKSWIEAAEPARGHRSVVITD
jgi:hypothetical protein